MTTNFPAVQDTPSTDPSTDRIEKRVVVRASPSRVWRAITSAHEFGTWFRMSVEGEFVEGHASW